MSFSSDFMERLFEASSVIESHAFLQRLAGGDYGITVWQHWGVQKYNASSLFIALLERGMDLALAHGFTNTHAALDDNLRDEKGIDRNGNPLRAGSHEDWRIQFYEALGIADRDLRTAD